MSTNTKLHIIGKETGTIKIVEMALGTKKQYDVLADYIKENPGDNVVNINKSDNSGIYILSLSDNWQQEIETVSKTHNLASRPLLVFGPEDTKAMREAMRLGAEDYYSNPEQIVELDTALTSIVEQLSIAKIAEETKKKEEKPCLVTTVINTQGGSGASFIAANLAHLFASQHKHHTALLDMDVQFGSHALNLDVTL
ncbi:MAG TPA: hypothetical protein ENK06_02615, partial [Gammaproteobacteria bacterium]|nr:hypothetical protein [Gammaproteobacteria bacterium]